MPQSSKPTVFFIFVVNFKMMGKRHATKYTDLGVSLLRRKLTLYKKTWDMHFSREH